MHNRSEPLLSIVTLEQRNRLQISDESRRLNAVDKMSQGKVTYLAASTPIVSGQAVRRALLSPRSRQLPEAEWATAAEWVTWE